MSIPPADQYVDYRLSAMASALRDSGTTLLRQDADHRFDIVEGAAEIWWTGDIMGKTEAAVFSPTIASAFLEAFAQSIAQTEPVSFQFEAVVRAERHTYTAKMHADAAGVLTTVTDVTERLVAEQALSSLLREVSHRSKNLLAIVQSVAMQTAVHSGGVQDFLDKFRGRLHALSGTQDLVTESNWRGTRLHALVGAQLTRVSTPATAQFSVTGDNPMLGPNAALHIGLAIHELAVNAVRHGAFSGVRAGHVGINASFSPTTSGAIDLVLEWRENWLDDAGEPTSPRFGTLVLERIVPLSVGGSATYAVAPGNVTYRLQIPSDQYEA